MSALVASRDDYTGGVSDELSVSQKTSSDRRVLIVDSNLLVAEAFVLALTQLGFTARFVVPITTAQARDLLAWRPGVALLDIDSVDNTTCLSFVSIFSDAKIPVAVMGSRLDAPLLGECVSAGASLVVDKGSPLTELVPTIARLLTGDVVLGQEERPRTLQPEGEARARRVRAATFDVLTHREKGTLAQLMHGHRLEDIAMRSSVPISTVRSQIKSILQKLGVNSQLAAASLARQAGWIFEETPG